jgi:hypothetical protein
MEGRIVAVKKKKAKAGAVAPLRKKYIYWLIAGLVVLGVLRGKDLLRSVQSKAGRSASSSPVVKNDSGSRETGGVQDNGRALISSVEFLSSLSINASNQLTVVRHIITATQDNKINPDLELAWIPRVVAIYRTGSQSWQIRTADGKSWQENDRMAAAKYGGLRVVYLDDRAVLLCPESDIDRPHPAVALPVGRIVSEDGERMLMVEKQRVCTGDHIYFAGWDFEIRMIARDRFEAAVKPLDAAEGQVLIYQFVL